MCGCGVASPCWGGCTCGCSHHEPESWKEQAEHFANQRDMWVTTAERYRETISDTAVHLYRDMRYYGGSDDPMSMGRVMGDSETFRVIAEKIPNIDVWIDIANEGER